jgi:4-hydroxy-tetrahydrodipicolinate synthase
MRPVRSRLAFGEDFCHLSGEDGTAVAFLAQGGNGCISVTANIAPRLCAQLQDAWHLGAYDDVFRLRDILTPLHDAMFVETNPTPVKFAASLLGKCDPEVRLPMVPLSTKSKARIEEAMRGAGLLN